MYETRIGEERARFWQCPHPRRCLPLALCFSLAAACSAEDARIDEGRATLTVTKSGESCPPVDGCIPLDLDSNLDFAMRAAAFLNRHDAYAKENSLSDLLRPILSDDRSKILEPIAMQSLQRAEIGTDSEVWCLPDEAHPDGFDDKGNIACRAIRVVAATTDAYGKLLQSYLTLSTESGAGGQLVRCIDRSWEARKGKAFCGTFFSNANNPSSDRFWETLREEYEASGLWKVHSMRKVDPTTQEPYRLWYIFRRTSEACRALFYAKKWRYLSLPDPEGSGPPGEWVPELD